MSDQEAPIAGTIGWVESVTTSAERCAGLGRRLIVSPKKMAARGRYCVIQDPAGAVAALFAPSSR